MPNSAKKPISSTTKPSHATPVKTSATPAKKPADTRARQRPQRVVSSRRLAQADACNLSRRNRYACTFCGPTSNAKPGNCRTARVRFATTERRRSASTKIKLPNASRPRSKSSITPSAMKKALNVSRNRPISVASRTSAYALRLGASASTLLIRKDHCGCGQRRQTQSNFTHSQVLGNVECSSSFFLPPC